MASKEVLGRLDVRLRTQADVDALTLVRRDMRRAGADAAMELIRERADKIRRDAEKQAKKAR
jgi:hypothetical protein